MAEKDLIIGAFSNYDFEVLKPWIKSIRNCNFQGDVVLIAVDATDELIQQIREEGIIVVSVKNEQKMMIHMLRFLHIHNFLKQHGSNYRYVITTDVRDVVFQVDPSLWLEYNATHPLIVQSEAIKIKDEPWNRENIIRNYGQYFYEVVFQGEVLNVGILAGRHEWLRDLCLWIFQTSLNRPDWVSDQAAFNMLMHTLPYKDNIQLCGLVDGWAINAHVTNKPDQMEQFGPYLLEPRPTLDTKRGIVVNHIDLPFVIVHQYDRVPEWNKFFMDKYNVVLTEKNNIGTAPKYFNYKT